MMMMIMMKLTMTDTIFFVCDPPAGGWTGDQERLGQISPGQTWTGGTSAGPDIVQTHTHAHTHNEL